MWAGSWAARRKVTVSGRPNRLNYCVIFILSAQFTNVSAARIISYNQAVRLLEAHRVKSRDFLFVGPHIIEYTPYRLEHNLNVP